MAVHIVTGHNFIPKLYKRTKTQVVALRALKLGNFCPKNESEALLLVTLVNEDQVKGTYPDLDKLYIEQRYNQ